MNRAERRAHGRGVGHRIERLMLQSERTLRRIENEHGELTERGKEFVVAMATNLPELPDGGLDLYTAFGLWRLAIHAELIKLPPVDDEHRTEVACEWLARNGYALPEEVA